MRRAATIVVLLAACASAGQAEEPVSGDTSAVPQQSTPSVATITPGSGSESPPAIAEPSSTAATTTSTAAATTTTTISAFARPEWLGTRTLPLRDDGFGEVQPTPDELRGRSFETLDLLPAPTGDAFAAVISPVPDEVLARSTWREECPVQPDELRYLLMTHWGFDGEVHTGEMIVNAAAADDVVWVFEQLFDAAFPIEQMRVIAAAELDLPPTGDFNDTTSFVCRPVVTSASTWSQHAFGLAVDINPFHNPYQKGDLVLPELASHYLDRRLGEPGMVVAGGVVAQAFAEIGWGWGGNWRSLDDYMHFSRNGR